MSVSARSLDSDHAQHPESTCPSEFASSDAFSSARIGFTILIYLFLVKRKVTDFVTNLDPLHNTHLPSSHHVVPLSTLQRRVQWPPTKLLTQSHIFALPPAQRTPETVGNLSSSTLSSASSRTLEERMVWIPPWSPYFLAFQEKSFLMMRRVSLSFQLRGRRDVERAKRYPQQASGSLYHKP